MTTKIYFVLDRSGSMEECLDDTIGGFNSFIRSQQNENSDNATLSLYQFDHEFETIYENKEIKNVPLLNKNTFIPRGRTALLDAIGKTINSIKKEDNVSIIVVILTDGFENDSKEFTNNHINDLINNKKDIGWEFIYLGANQDAIKEAGKIGINQQSSYTYSQDKEGITKCFDNLSQAVNMYRQTPQKQRKSKGISMSS